MLPICNYRSIFFALIFLATAVADWPHLSYDPENFLCTKYEYLCQNYLDRIGCFQPNRTVFGCGNPKIPSKPKILRNYVGICQCSAPFFVDAGGVAESKIAKEIFDNRIKPDVGWNLSPWTGPPFDVTASYTNICLLVMDRLGCAKGNVTMNPTGYKQASVSPYTCACGKFTMVGGRVLEVIVDKVNDAALMTMPIFADPLYLSMELSLAITVIVGKIGSIAATLLYLPPVIGFLLAGMAIQDVINIGLIKGCGGDGPKSTPFAMMRVFVLVIVLMRAGISLKVRELYSKGLNTCLVAVLPYLAEFAAALGIGMRVLGWDVLDMGLFASILGALSPSLVIPGMIKMVEEKPTLGYTPQTILNSAPLEVVLSIILYNIFATLVMPTNPLYPWVVAMPLWANIILIPVNIIFSCVLGFINGYWMSMYFHYRSNTNSPTVKRIVAGSVSEFLLIFIVGSYCLYSLCTVQYIQQSSGILAVFVTAITISEFAEEKTVNDLKDALAGVWTFAEIFLFTTTGINLSLRDVNGPQMSNRGIPADKVAGLIEIFLIGTLGRVAGIILVGFINLSTQPPHRRQPLYFGLWVVSTWMCQLPKAAVQATLGGLPFAYSMLSGIQGIQKAIFILQGTAFSVLFFATLGIFLTAVVGRPLAVYLAKMDRQAAGIKDDDEPAVAFADVATAEEAQVAKPVPEDSAYDEKITLEDGKDDGIVVGVAGSGYAPVDNTEKSV